MSRFLYLRSSVALSLGVSVLALAFACQPVPSADHSGAVDKIAFDLSTLDENGLYGPIDGKRSLDYEFCIPAGGAYAQAVSAIDPSAQFFPQSRGRIGCGEGEVLTIGNTYQANHQDILIELANLDYIDRIQPVDWE
ncbi:hypothetical protein VB780_16675 [Leptolyngbya sp. CCNP1308]|uniref:hypothetical protein n=1 Tax=Leptolyngbya sp. CCNP1308 TaxID=3110255 RepID=UPI002B20B06D|nr:hypothetical protein [Leptolyngbya sp. CCNP1308]MEA5450217.1 hypothetical protein [Leptolyngbya sp. CCNP1308]